MESIQEEEPLFFSGRLGYAFFEADKSYKGDGLVTLTGGLYYGYGLGYKLDDKLSLEAVYSHNFGNYHSNVLFMGDVDYDVD